jgi:transposase
LAARQRKSQSIAADLQSWMRAERTRLSRHAETAKAIDYMLKRWPVITRFLDDGRICLSNNAAERSLRGIALRRQAWLFAASGCCGERVAMYTLIATAKINNLDPKAWLPDVLARIVEHPASRVYELLPWDWKQTNIKSPPLNYQPSRSSTDAYYLSPARCHSPHPSHNTLLLPPPIAGRVAQGQLKKLVSASMESRFI